MDKKELLKESKEQFVQCMDNDSDNRNLQMQDLKFSTLDQWPEDFRNKRESKGLPCLTIDKINQYIVQVVNDMRKNKPGVKVRPIDDKADIKTADINMGIIRHIEDISNAEVAYSIAAESQVRVGEGYYRFVTDYPDPMSRNQEIYIKPIFDRFSVRLGPHLMPDGSDMEYAYIFEDISLETFKCTWPKAKTKAVEIDSGDTGYFMGEKTIRVFERFYKEYESVDIVFLDNGQAMTKEEFDKLPVYLGAPIIIQERTIDKPSIKWIKFTGAEILEETEWLGKYIPIVKVTGKQALIDGKVHTWGLVRPAKDSLKMYNYISSLIVEKMMMQPKAPFIGAVGQFETKGQDWADANNENLAYLEYDPIEVNGVVVPSPQRQQPAAFEGAMTKQLQLIEHDIQTSLGMFKASVGESDPQQSGKAILALQRESDTGTSHFPDGLSVSIRHGGRIMVDLIPKIYDIATIKRIIGEDGNSSSIEIDPNQQEAVKSMQMIDGSIKTIYNPGVGTYDVTVTVGPSYNTKRMEQAEMLIKMNEGDPTFKQVAGDILFGAMDWPDGLGQKLGDRYKKLLPPALQEGGQTPLPPEVQQKMQEMDQQLQQLGQENQQLKSGQQEFLAKIQFAREESQEKIRLKDEEFQAEIQLKRDAMHQDSLLATGKIQADGKLKQMVHQDTTSMEIDAAMLKIQTLIQVHEQKMQSMMDQESKAEDKAEGTEEPADQGMQMQAMHNEMMASIAQIMNTLNAKKVATFPDGRQVTIQGMQ